MLFDVFGQANEKLVEEPLVQVLGQLIEDEPVADRTVQDVLSHISHVFVLLKVP